MGYAAAAKLKAVKACGDLFPRLSVVISFGKQSGLCSPVAASFVFASVLSLVSFRKAFAVPFFPYIVNPDGAEYVPEHRTIPRAAVSHLAVV